MTGETTSAARDDAPTRRRSAGRRVTPERLRRILDAAAAIATESGLAAVTMQAVAKHTGYVRPVVYDCYGTPENILLALIDREGRLLSDDLGVVGGRVRTGGDLVDRLMTYVDSIFTHPGAWQLFTLPTEGVDDTVREAADRVRDGLRQSVARWLQPTVEKRPGPVDVEALSIFVLAAIDGIATTVVDDSGAVDRARIRAFLESLVTAVTLTPARRRTSR
ncbi:transcriptional regulator, TetR family [Nocardia nova SH22a]|uniref:Transcriptional regulator, TetR family n=1 Tax=Nocardia nova SH22a TaxID=1415166 RepID=W5TRZ2_9NOCA|nr:TetR/AcrR family transcriptional regulator [Nocardia nova]AHH19986.1 transcriptional regulator, TetR family [Nocardia nova SH22a]